MTETSPKPERPNRQTGPKTPEGKKRSSMNALKHGLTAESPHAFELLAAEAGIDFDAILDKMRTHYWPRDGLEDELVTRIARCIWRLALASAMERRALGRNPALGKPGASYERIMKFERLVDIHLHRAIAALERKRQADNKSNAQNETYPRSF